MKKASEFGLMAAVQVVFLGLAFTAGFVVRGYASTGALDLPALLGTRAAVVRYPLLDEVHALLATSYIGPLPDDKLLEYGAVRGLVGAVDDPYTVFVEPQAHELDSHSLQGEYGGVGMEMTLNEHGQVVLKPYRESPAAVAGVFEGDVLVAVDGVRLEGDESLDQVAARVRGAVGTTVRLTVRQANGMEVTFDIVRQLYELPSVTWELHPQQPHVGIVDINRFSDKTPDEVGQAIESLAAAGAQQYVIDLRDNGGGILESAVDVAGHFLNGGVVMYETQRNAPERIFTAPASDGPATRAPLVVLVNGNTASAAEIVAGALLDRGRAPLVGQPTYGKGSVQLVYDLSDGSSLHVTAYRWYTPTRRELEDGGLPPTFLVEPAQEGEDVQLAYAVQYLTGLAQGDLAPHLAQDSDNP